MRHINMLLGSTFLFMLAGVAWSETLLDVYQLAKKNDLEFLAKIYESDASSEVYEQARSAFFPTISAGYAYTYTEQDVHSADNSVYAVGATSFPTKEFSLDATQSIYNHANIVRLRQSRIELRKIAADLQVAQQALLLKVVERYFAVLDARAEQNNLQTQVKTFQRQLRLVRAKLKNGAKKNTAVTTATAASLDAEARLRVAGNRYQDALRALEEVTGRPVISIQLLKPVIKIVRPNPAAPEEWVALAQKNNPALLARHELFSMSIEEVNAQRAAMYPTLDFVARHGKKETEGSLFGGGGEVDTTKFAFELNVPIYSGGTTSSKVRQAQSLRKKSQAELDLTLRQVKRQTLSTYETVQAMIANIEALRQLVEINRAEAKSKRAAAKSGVMADIQALDALRALSQAETDLARAKHNYLINIARLKNIVGIMSEDDLRAMAHHFLGENIALRPR